MDETVSSGSMGLVTILLVKATAPYGARYSLSYVPYRCRPAPVCWKFVPCWMQGCLSWIALAPLSVASRQIPGGIRRILAPVTIKQREWVYCFYSRHSFAFPFQGISTKYLDKVCPLLRLFRECSNVQLLQRFNFQGSIFQKTAVLEHRRLYLYPHQRGYGQR